MTHPRKPRFDHRISRSRGGRFTTRPPRRYKNASWLVGWLVGWITSQQHASVSQGQICSNDCTCCHTEIEVADQTFYLVQSQYTDTRPTSPSADSTMPGAWSANFEVTDMTRPAKIPSQAGFEPRIFRSRGGRFSTRSPKRCKNTSKPSDTRVN